MELERMTIKMKVCKKYDIGIIAYPEDKKISDYIIPKSVILDNKHPVFEKGYWWLFFYFYKRKVCTRCGVVACKRGLIPLYTDILSKEKIIGWFCPSCGKSIKELHQRSRKRCNGCNSLHNGCDGGNGCVRKDVNK